MYRKGKRRRIFVLCFLAVIVLLLFYGFSLINTQSEQPAFRKNIYVGNFDQAIQELQDRIRISSAVPVKQDVSSDLGAYCLLGSVYALKKDYDIASAFLDLAIDEAKGNVGNIKLIQSARAVVNEADGNWEVAKGEYAAVFGENAELVSAIDRAVVNRERASWSERGLQMSIVGERRENTIEIMVMSEEMGAGLGYVSMHLDMENNVVGFENGMETERDQSNRLQELLNLVEERARQLNQLGLITFAG